MRVAEVIWHGYISVISPSMDHKCFILSHPKIELSPSTLCNEVIVCLRELLSPQPALKCSTTDALICRRQERRSSRSWLPCCQPLLYLASCVFLFSPPHHTLFHSFSKVAEDLFSIPPFLEGHLAVVMKGRDISVSSFLPAQNNLLRALCDQEEWWCPLLSRNCLSHWAGSVQTMLYIIHGNEF